MTTVGWIGLGKLGLPCALALARHGDVRVAGYDVNPDVEAALGARSWDGRIEAGMPELLATHDLVSCASVADVVSETSGLVFVAVPTPHDPAYGGETPEPDEPRDFGYDALVAVAREVAEAAAALERRVTLVVISTVLPGTMRRDVMPVLNGYVTLIYNPFFIAMGTTVKDLVQPEFVLIGADRPVDAEPLLDVYRRMYAGQTVDGIYHPFADLRVVGVETAELTKVAYNTFISMKLVFANTLLEICDETGADVDDVTDTLALGTKRILSPAYLRGGMGDGGACHPRDNIAMTWLARKLGLSADPFEFVTRAREAQTRRLAVIVASTVLDTGLPVVVLGKAYKPASDLTYGSPALLLAHYLDEFGVEIEHVDPYVDGATLSWHDPRLFVVATAHPEFRWLAWPHGSVVIDPWRYVESPPAGVTLLRLGSGRSPVRPPS